MKTEGKRNLLRQPDEIRLMTGGAQTEQETAPDAAAFRAGDVTVELAEADGSLAVFVQAQNTPVRELVLTWKAMFGGAGEVLGDTWERGYGDLEWKKEADHIGMPWYFFRHEAGKCLAFGVKVRPSAMCWWEKDGADVKLHLDVRCGTYGVKLGGRKLEADGGKQRLYCKPHGRHGHVHHRAGRIPGGGAGQCENHRITHG